MSAALDKFFADDKDLGYQVITRTAADALNAKPLDDEMIPNCLYQRGAVMNLDFDLGNATQVVIQYWNGNGVAKDWFPGARQTINSSDVGRTFAVPMRGRLMGLTIVSATDLTTTLKIYIRIAGSEGRI